MKYNVQLLNKTDVCQICSHFLLNINMVNFHLIYRYIFLFSLSVFI